MFWNGFFGGMVALVILLSLRYWYMKIETRIKKLETIARCLDNNRVSKNKSHK